MPPSESSNVRDRLDATIGQESSHTQAIARQRTRATDQRRRQGWRFIVLGAALIFSNLLVIPALAWLIAVIVEHPAADAVGDLTQLISEVSEAEGSRGQTVASPAGASNQTALSALANLKDQLRDFERAANQLPAALNSYTELQVTAATARQTSSSVIDSLAEALDQLESRTAVVPPVASNETEAARVEASFSTAELAALFTLVSPTSSAYQVRRDRRTRFNRWQDVTSEFYIIQRTSIGGAEVIDKARATLQKLGDSSRAVVTPDELRASGRRANGLLIELQGTEDTPGLAGQITETLTQVANAGDEITDLIRRVPSLQADAEAAVQTLSSTSKFIVPYGFAVLAIGAMFVSIGVSSVVKSLRMLDDGYEDARDDRRTRMYSELIEVLDRDDSIRVDALVDRLGRIGEAEHQDAPGIPTPFARAVEAIAEAVKR